MNKASFETKKSLIGTLRALKKGDEMVIKEKDFKTHSVRVAACKLKKEGILVTVSEQGMLGECRVTRTA